MTTAAHALSDLEARAASGAAMTRADAEAVAACPDLASVGMLGDGLRRAWRGNRVTFGRVLVVEGDAPETAGEAGEVRLAGAPATLDAARARVRDAVARAGGVPVTAFSLADLEALAGDDHVAMAEIGAALRADGLDGLAEVVLDRVDDLEAAAASLRAVARGGLAARRATIHAAPDLADRLRLLEIAAALQEATGAFRAVAPLPRLDSADTPSTGYDDVRTVAAARLRCRAIPSIQVDWLLYGPKLAQVAIAYGADDLDAVPAHDVLKLGHRRSPREDLERQIRAAFAAPAERDGRYAVRE